jgi:hypothetical protein
MNGALLLSVLVDELLPSPPYGFAGVTGCAGATGFAAVTGVTGFAGATGFAAVTGVTGVS